MKEEPKAERPNIAVVFLGVAVVLILSLALTYWTGLAALQSQRQLAENLGVMERLEQVFSTLKDVETGQRGYLLTGEERYLEPYHEAAGQLPGQLAELSRLAARAGCRGERSPPSNN